nr:DUF4340 domain-containing protein [bacterium]
LRRNIILVIILALLGAWYFFYEIRGSEVRQREAVEASRLLPGVLPDDVQSVTLIRLPLLPPDTAPMNTGDLQYRIRVENSPEGWVLTEPVRAQGNQVMIDQMVRDMTELTKGRVIAREGDDLNSFGLDAPAFMISVESATDSLELSLGNETPTGDAYYARRNEQNEIFLVDRSIQSYLLKKAIDYRDRRIIQDRGESLTAISIRYAQGIPPIALVKTGTEWRMEAPEPAPADSSRIRDIIETLAAVQIPEFIDDPDDPLRYGLANPSLEITLVQGDRSRRLAIGADADPGGKFQFGRWDDSGPVFTLPRNVGDLFADDPFFYRSKTICDLDRAVIHRIEIRHDDTSMEIRRDETLEWRVTSPELADTDTDAVAGFISDIVFMRATGIKPPQEDFGTTVAMVRFFDATGEMIWEGALGGIPPDGVGRWIQSSDQTVIFRIGSDDVRRLMPDIFTFRDTSLLSFDRYQMTSIVIHRGKGRLMITPEGDSFTSTGGGDISASVLEQIYWCLHTLKMDRLIREFNQAPAPEALAEFGLDSPVMTVRVEMEDGAFQSIELGWTGGTPDEIFVRKGSPGLIAAVDAYRLEPLMNLQFQE